jgi:hypothetical protein
VPGSNWNDAIGIFSNVSRYTKHWVYKSVKGQRHYSYLVLQGILPNPGYGYAPRPQNIPVLNTSICGTVNLFVDSINEQVLIMYRPHFLGCPSCKNFVQQNPNICIDY